MKQAVIKTGGKQYLIKQDDQLFIDRLKDDKESEIDLDCLAIIDSDKQTIELGKPLLKNKIKAKVVDHLQADKIRVAKFKSKVRYRRAGGFRHQLTKIRIGSLGK